MKKITFLAFLLATGISQAQSYCNISDDYEGIEEITSVVFSDASITNADDTLIQIDQTATVANVNVGQGYNLAVQGNSHGDYDNEYVAYVDWNQNGTLNDDGEVFYIGKITNSDGADGQSVSTDIVIPNTATLGNTRIRVVKVYTDEADDYILNQDPCYISIEDIFFGDFDDFYGSYGQAIDFTLNVTQLGNNTFTKNLFSFYPNPARDVLNLQSTKNIDEISIYNMQGQLLLASKNSNQINVAQLATGHYLIKAASDGFLQTEKFVKQ